MKITRLLCGSTVAVDAKILFRGVVVLTLAYAPCLAQADGGAATTICVSAAVAVTAVRQPWFSD